MCSGGCRGRVIVVPFVVKDSPRAGRPVCGGQASQWRPGCALHTTMSVDRTSFGSSVEVRRALSVVVVEVLGTVLEFLESLKMEKELVRVVRVVKVVKVSNLVKVALKLVEKK